MNLLLARHGETDWNARGHIQGVSDTELNDTGRRQAEDLAQRLGQSGVTIDCCYTSPLRRARETAEIVCQTLVLSPVVVEDFREVSFGLWEGHTWDEVEAEWQGLYTAYQRDRRSIRPPEGESYGDLLDRVLPALARLEHAGPGTALVVCHSAVIKAVLGHRAGVPFDNELLKAYMLDNAQWVAL